MSVTAAAVDGAIARPGGAFRLVRPRVAALSPHPAGEGRGRHPSVSQTRRGASAAEQVAELGALRLQVFLVVRVAAGVKRQALDDLDAELLEGFDLARIVGHQADTLDAQMAEHRRENGVVAHVRPEPQALVGLDGIGTEVLQVVGFDLVEQPDATALLAQVEQRPAPGPGNGPQCRLQLVAAVTAQAEQGITGKALGMDAAEDGLAVADVAHGEDEVLLVGGSVLVAVHGEGAEVGGEFGGLDVVGGHARNLLKVPADGIRDCRVGRVLASDNTR